MESLKRGKEPSQYKRKKIEELYREFKKKINNDSIISEEKTEDLIPQSSVNSAKKKPWHIEKKPEPQVKAATTKKPALKKPVPTSSSTSKKKPQEKKTPDKLVNIADDNSKESPCKVEPEKHVEISNLEFSSFNEESIRKSPEKEKAEKASKNEVFTNDNLKPHVSKGPGFQRKSLLEIKKELKERKSHANEGMVSQPPASKEKPSKLLSKSMNKGELKPKKPAISRINSRSFSIDYSKGVSKQFFDMKKKIREGEKKRAISMDQNSKTATKKELPPKESSALKSPRNNNISSPQKKIIRDHELKKAFMNEKRKELNEKYTIMSPKRASLSKPINSPKQNVTPVKPISNIKSTYKVNRPRIIKVTEASPPVKRELKSPSSKSNPLITKICEKISYKGYFVLNSM